MVAFFEMTLDAARERLRPYVEKAQAFSGWMPEVRTRRLGPKRPWDYARRARELLAAARSVIDLGTGGGERFSELLPGFRGRAVATEEWVVNAPIAATRLRPLGVGVVRCQSLRLPFNDRSFDLVLDRHEELDPAEVARVLIPGGRVLTQQFSGDDLPEIKRFFPRRTDFGDLFRLYQEGFRTAGLAIADASKHTVAVAYDSLGELVYMLYIAPWTIANFDPLGQDLEALLALERALTTDEGLVLTSESYIIEARKHAPGRV